MLCACLMPAWVAAAEEPAAPAPENRQSVPAKAASAGGPQGSDRPLPAGAPAKDAGLDSFKPSESIPADSAVAFPADI